VQRLRLLVPANIRHNSGGNVYNARLTQGLRALGIEVDVLPVDGSWPESNATERRRLGSLLGAEEPHPDITKGTVIGETVTLLDGLIACGVPEELESAAAAGQRTWVLLHMPSPSHPEGEARALRAAAGIICTSSSAKASVTERHGLPASHVALPGTDTADVAPGSDPPHIIAVAALLPNKDQLLIVGALAMLKDLAWTASLVGADDADPAYAALVRRTIAVHGLEARVQVTGQLRGKALQEEWNRADLSLLVSRAESFGLVVTESLARGIPVIVRQGTGAIEALTFCSSRAGKPDGEAGAVPGAAVGLSTSPEPLAAAIRQWLSEPGLRAGWRTAALAARENLPGWDAAARTVLGILEARPEGAPSAAGTSGGQ
jgi:glycosyltransferase involved in cell wall biosynthesis